VPLFPSSLLFLSYLPHHQLSELVVQSYDDDVGDLVVVVVACGFVHVLVVLHLNVFAPAEGEFLLGALLERAVVVQEVVVHFDLAQHPAWAVPEVEERVS
jgi:hypothetical protein